MTNPMMKPFFDFFTSEGVTFVDHETGEIIASPDKPYEELKKPTALDVVNGTEAGKVAVRKALGLSCKEQEEMAKEAEAVIEKEGLSLCDGCCCMTKTKDGKCGKCGEEKGNG